MAKRILVPIDHVPPIAELLDLVHDAARGGGAVVRLIHVAPLPDNLIGSDGRVMAFADQEGARVEAEWRDLLRPVECELGDVPVDSVVCFGDPVTAILREAVEFEADLVAMPSHGRTSVGRLVFGSVAEQIAHRAPMAVALVRARTRHE